MKTAELKNGRTILLTEDEDGTLTPMPVILMMRFAESAPTGTRVKASLVALDRMKTMPLPFAVPTVQITDGEFGPVTVPGFTPEFRLEMN